MTRSVSLSLSLPVTASISVLLFVSLLVSPLAAQSQPQWTVAGQDLNNSRSQPAEHLITTSNVHGLSPKWVFQATNDVSATPTVYKQAVYFPDWGGNLYAVNKQTGTLIWSHPISEYDGVIGSLARVSPAVDIANDQLIIGDNVTNGAGGASRHNPGTLTPGKLTTGGASVIAVDQKTGLLRWITTVEQHPAAIITGSPVVFDGVIYIGVSSSEESLAAAKFNKYPCCTFRGSVVALNAKTGKMLWQTFMVPENGGVPGGYSGAVVWQPPAIDTKRGTLYVGTGDNYTVPAQVAACQNKIPNEDCTALDDYFDSVLALDLKTGHVIWSRKARDFDTWTVACLTRKVPNKNCEVPASPDFDFGGSGPNLVGDIVGFGQKSGIYWALDPDSGDLVWATPVGPGSDLGGIEWGTATDGKRIYVAISDADQIPYTLVPLKQTITWGSWSALDVATGKILWQTADPTSGTLDIGSVSVANGVLYAPSLSGQMYALNAQSGKILWSFASGGSVIDGPSIVDGTVYWGSGYNIGTGNNKVYAFSVGGKN